jgi:hypothetical protein
MKNRPFLFRKNGFLACFVVVLTAGTIPAQEQTIGTAQVFFTARDWDALLNKDAITTQAYGNLLEAARKKYPETVIDVRDVIWTRGKKVDNLNSEIAATGKIVQVSADDAVAGLVQVSFTALSWDSWFNKNVIKTQAYIRLLEAAQQKHPGLIDIRDIVWITGKMVSNQNKEIIATGKVVQVNQSDN